MSDRVILPLGALGVLDIPRELFEAHLVRVAAPAEPPRESGPALLTAEEIAAQTATKASWWMQMAREHRVPHHKVGRRVRFVLAEVLASDAFRLRGVTGQGDQREGASD